MKLNRSFFEDNTIKVAKNLLGKFLVVKNGDKILRGVIIETEAYRGEDDLACHASKGRTKRTETLYKEAGTVYVYMIYGMYFCLNIVTEMDEYPSAVLIRGVMSFSDESSTKAVNNLWKTITTLPRRQSGRQVGINGPGRVCRYFGIDKKFNGSDVETGDLWIEDSGLKISPKKIEASKRIGIDYAKHCRDYLWRFNLL
ncbi:DNA-3-methyladenine glycosylase [Candidatus Parcubacteria bacterium]|nr:MAG: DNA-3-methyladenine glycosylase [Candidatus Parcubacteria bacterium]